MDIYRTEIYKHKEKTLHLFVVCDCKSYEKADLQKKIPHAAETNTINNIKKTRC